MTSQWEKLCAILDRADTMPAKHKAAYLQSALVALAFESHTNLSAGDLKAMTSKMRRQSQPDADSRRAVKKRRRTM